MKKALILTLLSFLLIHTSNAQAEQAKRQFQGTGEVLTVDPVYSQVTIQHKAIKNFSGDRDSQFHVSAPGMLKDIQKGDLVEFELTDDKGDVNIDKITKTGVALPKDESSPLGQAVNDVLHGTGQVVRGVTEPIAPIHAVAKGATGLTDATGEAVKETGTEVKSVF